MQPMEHEPHLVLDEAFYESAVPDQIRLNKQAQREISLMFAKSRADAPAFMDLELTPSFMRNSDGSLIDKEQAFSVGQQVLAGLHETWNGTEPVDNVISETATETYWEFVDDEFFPWTVVEFKDANADSSSVGLSAHISRAHRPKAFQDIINANEAKRAELQMKKSLEPQSEAAKPTRRNRASKKISKVLKNLRDHPGAGNDPKRWL